MLATCIRIQEQTDSAQARREAVSVASSLSFEESLAGSVALVVTEAATNILKHAGSGQIVLRALESHCGTGIEMLALDKGPGIAEPGRCFRDGYSTAGTAGDGLGAISRLSTVHDVYTQPGQGTVLMAQIWKRRPSGQDAGAAPRFRVGGVSVPMAGEEECGDSWLFNERGSFGRLTVADGLGHGVCAADASRAATRAARENPGEHPPALLERIHGALRATRGAAVAVAEIDPPARVLHFAGIGNVAAAVVPTSGPVRRLVSNTGTAGHNVRKILEFSAPWASDSLLVMHSDGLQTHWSFDPYPGLLQRHPSVIAGVMYRDYARGRDDVTVVVARETGAAS